jgi:hypothetical protein
MNDVVGELSRRVFDERGVLVDCVGGELLVMWGAPEEQPDQAAISEGGRHAGCSIGSSTRNHGPHGRPQRGLP